MAALLDIIFSMLFGGMLFMVVLTANDIATENQSVYNGDMLVQQMLTSTAQLVEGEFRNMGFGVPEMRPAIIQADTGAIAFMLDLNRDGVVDTIRYSLGPTSDLAGTQNELDRFLYRDVNATGAKTVGTVTQFHLDYFTKAGEQLPTPVPSDRLSEIHVVEVTMEVQNPYALNRPTGQVQTGERGALYSTSLWQQTRLASQNSRR